MATRSLIRKLRRQGKVIRKGQWPQRLWCRWFKHHWENDLSDDTAITCNRCGKWGQRYVYIG